MAQTPHAFDELARAINAGDVARLAGVIAAHPELKSVLNDPMPGGAFGATPLICAVQRTNREMIETLLGAGADINQKSHWWAGGFTVIDNAVQPNRPDWLIPLLIERGVTIDLRAAVRLGMLENARELILSDPAAVHAPGGDGQLPLHVAPTVPIAQLLLDHGARIDARDIDHESTPAQYLVRDHPEVARLLVSRGCATDILLVAAVGDVDLVRRHLDDDPASVHTSVSDKYFPMKNPRAGGHIYIWTLGANKTAHLVAREFGHDECFRLLMERTPVELKLALACELGDEETFGMLLARRPDIARTLSPEERRKIADAAQANNVRAVRLMLAAGWPVDARGQHDATPLHWAAFNGNAEIVREILRHNPPLNARGDQFNSPPVGWAIHGSKNTWHRATADYGGTVELLLNAGAEPPKDIDKVDATESVREVLRRYASARGT